MIRIYTDLDVLPKTGVGGTKICFDALMNDQIDLMAQRCARWEQIKRWCMTMYRPH